MSGKRGRLSLRRQTLRSHKYLFLRRLKSGVRLGKRCRTRSYEILPSTLTVMSHKPRGHKALLKGSGWHEGIPVRSLFSSCWAGCPGSPCTEFSDQSPEVALYWLRQAHTLLGTRGRVGARPQRARAGRRRQHGVGSEPHSPALGASQPLTSLRPHEPEKENLCHVT